MTKTVIITTAAHIDAQIATFTTNRDTLRNLAHEIGMLVFYRAAPKAVGDDCSGVGDCTRALKLVDAMPKSWGDQMRAWFATVSPIVVKGGKVGFDPRYKALTENKATALRSDGTPWWNLELANSTPFYEMNDEKGEEDYKTFADILKLVPQLAARIKKMADEGKIAVNDKLSALNVADTLAGLTFTKVEAPANSNTNDASPATQEQAPKKEAA